VLDCKVIFIDSEPDIMTREVQGLKCDVKDFLERSMMRSSHGSNSPLLVGTASILVCFRLF